MSLLKHLSDSMMYRFIVCDILGRLGVVVGPSCNTDKGKRYLVRAWLCYNNVKWVPNSAWARGRSLIWAVWGMIQ